MLMFYYTLSLQEVRENFQTMATKVAELKTILTALMQARAGDPAPMFAAMGVPLPAGAAGPTQNPGQAAAAVSAGPRDECKVTEAEANLAACFPINEYTPAVQYLLGREIVKDYVRNEMMKRLYGDSPTHRPDAEGVAYNFLDFMFTLRLQSHICQGTAHPKSVDFGRFPMPKVVMNMYDSHIANLGQPPLPGMRQPNVIMKDRTATVRRSCILGSTYIDSADTVQVITIRLYWERMSFFKRHSVRCPPDVMSLSLLQCIVPAREGRRPDRVRTLYTVSGLLHT